jgi:hypothetical protein
MTSTSAEDRDMRFRLVLAPDVHSNGGISTIDWPYFDVQNTDSSGLFVYARNSPLENRSIGRLLTVDTLCSVHSLVCR